MSARTCKFYHLKRQQNTAARWKNLLLSFCLAKSFWHHYYRFVPSDFNKNLLRIAQQSQMIIVSRVDLIYHKNQ